MKSKYIVIPGLAACLLFNGCTSGNGKGAGSNALSPNVSDTSTTTCKVSMIISSIPFPTAILDTLHTIHAAYQSSLPNPVESISLYSQSNEQAVNLGVYGADLAYVISFDQFEQVGPYMKSTKYLADNAGIPMAFTQNIIQRCENNSHNQDSLDHIIYESYNIIDKTLKEGQRKEAEVLVLAGGWIEGMYLTTQSLGSVPDSAGRVSACHVIMAQANYLDKLLTLVDAIQGSDYCQRISTPLHAIKKVLDTIKNPSQMSDTVMKDLARKVSDLRIMVVKGGTA